MHAPITIFEAEAGQQETWNAFAQEAPGANYSHRWAWADLIQQVYQLATKRLVARAGTEWVALFSATLTPSRPGLARHGVSLAYCLYGDVLVKPGWAGQRDQLRRALLQEMSRQGINVVQVRSREPVSAEAPEMSFLLDLPDDGKKLWQQVGDKVRNQVRKAQRNGLTTRFGWDQLDSFYEVYAKNMGRLGTPVHAKDFFAAHFSCFGSDAELLTVSHENRTIAGMLIIKFRDTWVNPIASSLPGSQKNNPNMLMYWEALNAACEQGARVFDFGRSPLGSGTQRFKKQWGALPYPLHHHAYVGGELAAGNSTRFYRGALGRIASTGWSWLPGALQHTLGPRFRRWML